MIHREELLIKFWGAADTVAKKNYLLTATADDSKNWIVAFRCFAKHFFAAKTHNEASTAMEVAGKIHAPQRVVENCCVQSGGMWFWEKSRWLSSCLASRHSFMVLFDKNPFSISCPFTHESSSSVEVVATKGGRWKQDVLYLLCDTNNWFADFLIDDDVALCPMGEATLSQ